MMGNKKFNWRATSGKHSDAALLPLRKFCSEFSLNEFVHNNSKNDSIINYESGRSAQLSNGSSNQNNNNNNELRRVCQAAPANLPPLPRRHRLHHRNSTRLLLLHPLSPYLVRK